MRKIVVIGAGPAGMMAAITAAQNGAQVILVEKKDRVGRKLSITGKGRCNLTAAVDKPALIAGMVGNGRFLYSAFNEFSNRDLMDWFARRGLRTKVERGQRVFPESDRASDVVQVMQDALEKTGVQVLTGHEVRGLNIDAGRIKGVRGHQEDWEAYAVIVATGGLSYPGTGSTGDGYRWAAQAGHTIVEPRPGLVPLVAAEDWIEDLQGLSLRNTRATAYDAGGKKIVQDMGELLFTHYGLSGPIILSMSRDIGEYLYRHGPPVRIELDLKPALREEKLDERVLRDLGRNARKMFKNSLDELLPQRLIGVIITLSGIEPTKACHQVGRSQRLGLVHLLKHLPLTITGTRPIAEAIVTAGGVSIKEVHPRTMGSKLVEGLFLAGEVLDVDGYTGGYNLQAAFSTGYVAGKYAARPVD